MPLQTQSINRDPFTHHTPNYRNDNTDGVYLKHIQYPFEVKLELIPEATYEQRQNSEVLLPPSE